MGECGGPGVRVVVGWGGLLHVAFYEIIFVAIDTFVVGRGRGVDRLLVLGGMSVLHGYPSWVGARMLLV
jgi:hypothetical protein